MILFVLAIALLTATFSLAFTVLFPMRNSWKGELLGTCVRSMAIFGVAQALWLRFHNSAHLVLFIFTATILQLVGCCGFALKSDASHG